MFSLTRRYTPLSIPACWSKRAASTSSRSAPPAAILEQRAVHVKMEYPVPYTSLKARVANYGDIEGIFHVEPNCLTVTYTTPEAARNLVVSGSFTIGDVKLVRAEFARRLREHKPFKEKKMPSPHNVIFVEYMPRGTSSKDLAHFIRKECGCSVTVTIPSMNGRPRTWAYVVVPSNEVAQHLVEGGKELVLMGRVLKLQYAKDIIDYTRHQERPFVYSA